MKEILALLLSTFDWTILTLICPPLLIIALFAYLQWSDRRYYRNKLMKTKNNNN